MTELKAGDPAPGFRLRDQNGNWVSLADFTSGKVVLYFYPAALTPGCTVEAIDFTAARSTFGDAGYTILGVSPDEPEVLAKFVTRHDLDLTLLSDPELTTIKAYGAWGERMLWGKMLIGLIRSTFLIEVAPDGQGRIIEAQMGVRATGHVKRLLDSLGLNGSGS